MARTREGRCRSGRTDIGSLRLLAGSSPFFPVSRNGPGSPTGPSRFRAKRGNTRDPYALRGRPGPLPGIRREDCRTGSLPGMHLSGRRGGSSRNFHTGAGALLRSVGKGAGRRGKRRRNLCSPGRGTRDETFRCCPVLPGRSYQKNVHDIQEGPGRAARPQDKQGEDRQEMGGHRPEKRPAEPRRLPSFRNFLPASHAIQSCPPPLSFRS